MGAFTQKIAGHFALPFFPFRGQKTRAPNYCFQPGISDSSFEGAKTIRLAPVVNRLFRPVIPRHAEDFLKFTSARQSRKRIFNYFYPTNAGYLAVPRLFQAPLG
jgi:hypothetical protein